MQSEVGADIREALASAVVNGGFGLMELRPAHLSLEEIFLQLTTTDVTAGGGVGVRNVWAVATRELRSYFLSPLAYVVIALVSGAVGLSVRADPANGREASLRGLVQNVQRAVPVRRPDDQHAPAGRGAAHRHHRAAADQPGAGVGDRHRQVSGVGPAGRGHARA